MLLKETLRGIVKSQKEEFSSLDFGIEREKLKDIDLKLPFALILSGVRRCGKSTLLLQLMKKAKNFCYFNFEDPRATGFDTMDFQKLNEVFLEEYGKCDFYFFDEIQNVHGWEIFVRAMLDKKKHFVITGSNASLLSRELGTKLTGRHIRHELFPFSFKEFLALKKKEPTINSFHEYLKNGGFPQYLKIGKAEILQELFNDIILRDIAIRHKVRNLKTIKEMALYLLTNAGKEFSYGSLKKIFNLGSTNSAISFVSYFEDSYMLFVVPSFDYSFKKRLVGPKKIYSVDTGMTNANSASFSEDNGRALENAVFLNLRRDSRDIFYFKGRGECDFLVKEGAKISRAIQVCLSLNEDNKEREIGGLVEAMEKFDLKEGLILTESQEDEIKINRKRIKVMQAFKWMMK